MFSLLNLGINLVERGMIPDVLTRRFIRRLCAQRLRDSAQSLEQKGQLAKQRFLQSLRNGPIAPLPEKANEQHYELPAEFFTTALGPHHKYSCCFFQDEHSTLEQAESAALTMTCERAELADGQEILELGCGWGSLSLWMAEHYPRSRITAVSNSASQRAFIEAEARTRQIDNLRVLTADMNEFSAPPDRYHRVVSVEMFEHMRNYRELLHRIAGWLRPEGKLFVHHFCHRELIYPFETAGSANWMGRHFFSGGMMPSAGLLQSFDQSMSVTRQWSWNGRHYQKTAEAWLANLDARSDESLRILRSVHGSRNALRWLNRWRMFFLAVSELFGYAGGEEWYVSHSLMEPIQDPSAITDHPCRLLA